MPTVYTGSYKIPFEAGKSLGQISAEKESYTRGVEQARIDLQKKTIADNRTERALARIDAEEKEKRRQLEWGAIAKRAREATEESKRRFELGRTELTAAQKATQERLKEGEQIRTEQWEKNLKRLEDTAKTSKEQWEKTEGRQKEQWGETHKLDIQKLEETKKYRETLNKLKEIALQQKGTQEIAKAEKAGEKAKLNLAQAILKGDADYSDKDRQWAGNVISKYTGGAGTTGATTDVLGIR